MVTSLFCLLDLPGSSWCFSPRRDPTHGFLSEAWMEVDLDNELSRQKDRVAATRPQAQKIDLPIEDSKTPMV